MPLAVAAGSSSSSTGSRVLQLTSYHLKPVTEFVGKTDVVMCRSNDANDAKHLKRASEVAVATVKRKLVEMKVDASSMSISTEEKSRRKSGATQNAQNLPTDGTVQDQASSDGPQQRKAMCHIFR